MEGKNVREVEGEQKNKEKNGKTHMKTMRNNGKKKQRKTNTAKIGWRTLFRGGFTNNFRKIGVLYFGEYINTTRTIVANDH